MIWLKRQSSSGILVKPTTDSWSVQRLKKMVQIRQGATLSVDAKALNNEASVHAYNRGLKVRLPITFGSRGEKESQAEAEGEGEWTAREREREKRERTGRTGRTTDLRASPKDADLSGLALVPRPRRPEGRHQRSGMPQQHLLHPF